MQNKSGIAIGILAGIIIVLLGYIFFLKPVQAPQSQYGFTPSPTLNTAPAVPTNSTSAHQPPTTTPPASTTGSTASSNASQPLAMTSPSAGAEWQRGSAQTIRWSGGVPNYVLGVQLLTPDMKNKTGCPGYAPGSLMGDYDCRQYVIHDDTPNNGSLSWTVGSDENGVTIPSGQYYIRIVYSEIGMETAHSLSSTEAYGGPFTIY